MLAQLIKYTEVADFKFIEIFANVGRKLPEAEKLFSHILNAQHIWVSRLNNEIPLYDRFHLHPVEYFESLHRANISELHTLAAADLSFTVKYKTAQAGDFESSALDIMYHIVNHSTYHRAQVATQFRLNGIEPPATDFILLKRQHQL